MTPESQTCATGIHQSSLSRRSLNSSESLWDEVEWRNRFALHLSRLLYKFTFFYAKQTQFAPILRQKLTFTRKTNPIQTQFLTLFFYPFTPFSPVQLSPRPFHSPCFQPVLPSPAHFFADFFVFFRVSP